MSSSFVSGEKHNESFYQAQRFMILAAAYETQENKELTINFYKDALKHNCESVNAFDKLISNYLLSQQEKKDLVKSMTFT